MNNRWYSKFLAGFVISLILISQFFDPALAATIDNITKAERSSFSIFTDCASQTEIPAAECDALVALYSSTNGASWTDHTGWLQTDTPCSWYGVTCTAGHVTELNQYYNNLSGSLPAQLGDLTNLTNLDLSVNQLTGTIPAQLGGLTNLTSLNLGTNIQLTGSIPVELGGLTNLQYLRLYSTQLMGSIPAELGNLTNLIHLNLAYSRLTGSIPPQLGSLPNLTELLLTGNHLTGSIPAELGNLANLTDLDLSSGNRLSGSIPVELGSLTNLRHLGLSENVLTGNIPAELGNLTKLVGLYIFGTQLTGNIPPQLGNLTNLQYLYLDDNRLTGRVPVELGNLTKLEILLLGNNNLGGEIPASITNLTSLTMFTLSCGLFATDPSVIAFVDGLIPGWQNRICPVVSSIARSYPSPTSLPAVNFTVTFSESVSGVNMSAPFDDFALTSTGIFGASITRVSGSGATYIVTVNTGSGGGTLRLNVVDDNSILNATNHALGGPGAWDGDFTDGETYLIWGFQNIARWTNAFDQLHNWNNTQHVRTVGDVSGDGRNDLVGFGLDGVYVALSTGNGFAAISKWTSSFDQAHGWNNIDHVRTVGDLNGDGKDDLVGFGLDGVYVALSTDNGFGSISKWTSSFDQVHGWNNADYVRTVGDVNADGKDDLVGFGSDGVYAALSTGSAFGSISKWMACPSFGFCWFWNNNRVRTVGDVNGDNKADVVWFDLSGAYVALSNGSSFGSFSRWTTDFDYVHGWTVDQHVRTVGDVNGDGMDDLIGFGLNGVYVALSTGSGFSPISRWTNAFDLSHGWTVSQRMRTAGDVNGDGKADLVGFGLDGVYIATSR